MPYFICVDLDIIIISVAYTCPYQLPYPLLHLRIMIIATGTTIRMGSSTQMIRSASESMIKNTLNTLSTYTVYSYTRHTYYYGYHL